MRTAFHRCLSVLAALLVAAVAVASESALTPTELARWQSEHKAPLVIDVRSEAEFREGHIPGAVNIPHDQIATRIASTGIRPDQAFVLYCRSGRRVGIARQALEQAGYVHSRALEGSFEAWQKAGLAIEKSP